MRKSCQIAKAKLRSILYQQDTPGSFAPLNCVLCCCISVTDINSIWISVSACLQLLRASMSVLEAAFITRGIANPGAVGEFWTAQGFRDHHNRLQQTPLVLKFLWGQKEDIVFSLLPSSPGSSLDWPQGSLSITCTSGKMYRCFLTPEHRAGRATCSIPNSKPWSSQSMTPLLELVWKTQPSPLCFNIFRVKTFPHAHSKRSRSSKSTALPAKSTKELKQSVLSSFSQQAHVLED